MEPCYKEVGYNKTLCITLWCMNHMVTDSPLTIITCQESMKLLSNVKKTCTLKTWLSNVNIETYVYSANK